MQQSAGKGQDGCGCESRRPLVLCCRCLRLHTGSCWITQAGYTQPLTKLAPERAEEVDELEDMDATLGGQRFVGSSGDIEQCHDLHEYQRWVSTAGKGWLTAFLKAAGRLLQVWQTQQEAEGSFRAATADRKLKMPSGWVAAGQMGRFTEGDKETMMQPQLTMKKPSSCSLRRPTRTLSITQAASQYPMRAMPEFRRVQSRLTRMVALGDRMAMKEDWNTLLP